MTLDEYLSKLQAWQLRFQFNTPSGFYKDVVDPWFTQIAPYKAREYGMECWLRLGPLGLYVDINACYYRLKRFRDEASMTKESFFNALRDMFGYSVMMLVMLEESDYEQKKDMHRMFWMIPHNLDMKCLDQLWKCPHDITGEEGGISVRMTYNYWRWFKLHELSELQTSNG